MDLEFKTKHWLIIFFWTLAAVLSFLFLAHASKPFIIGGITDPNAESSLAMKTLTSKLAYGNSRLFILYESNLLTANDPQFVTQVEQSLAGLKKFSLPHRILSPYDHSQQIAKNQHAAFAVVVLEETADSVANYMQEFHQLLGKPSNLKMFVGGQPAYINDVNKLSEESLLRGEMIAFPLCLIALVFIFRGIVAALIPVILGVINCVIILTTLYILGHLFELSVFVLNVATILGLAFSLDYSLLISYRFREELLKQDSIPAASQVALRTAGKAVFYSGLAMVISMASLIFFPINVLFSIGIAGVVVIIVVLLSSMTLLPAILCLLGPRINAWSMSRNVIVDQETNQTNFWLRFANKVMQYPLVFLIPTVAFLFLLGYPFIHVKPNRADASILPTTTQSRQLADAFAKYFNANELSPINILIQSKQFPLLSYESVGDLYDFAQELKKDNRVDSIASIVTFDPKLTKYHYQDMYYYLSRSELSKDQQRFLQETTTENATVMFVVSKYPANEQHTFDLVRKIRQTRVGADFTSQVTGNSAIIIDTIDSVYALFVKLIIMISIITYVVLLFYLRSLVLPLKAIIMNFLSLSVCYGMLVFIFQEGHLSWLFDFTPLGYTDLNQPILLFFSLFGISMDYEVFLLSRIKEIYEKTGDNNLSVAVGLQKSARIITSAALLVVIITGSFVTADIIFVKSFSLGIALAVAIDATIIRMLLVPATMRLLGKWNWYWPASWK